MVTQNQSEYMTRDELAALLQISKAALERQAHEGRGIPYIKFGRLARYRRSDVDSYLSSHCANSATAHRAMATA